MLTMKQDPKTLSKHKTEKLCSPPNFEKRHKLSLKDRLYALR